MKELNPGFKKALWVWLAGLVALLLFYGIILGPQQRRVNALQYQVTTSSERADRLKKAESPAYQESIRTELQSIEQQYNALCAQQDQLNRLDFRIRDLANQSRINAFSSENAARKSDKYFVNLKLTDQRQWVVTLNADFISFLRLINALERNQPALFIHQMQLSLSTTSDEKDLPEGRIEFAALFAKAPEEETAAKTQ